MSSKNQNIEELFSSEFEAFKIEPDSHVLKNIRFKLWKADFLSLNMRKFNIAYTGIIIAGITGMAIFVNNNDVNEPQSIISNNNPGYTQEQSIDDKPETEVISAVVADKEKSPVSPLALFSTSTIEGCAPLKVNFKDASQYAIQYSWNFGDGTQSTDKNPEHIYKNPGNYIAELVITGEDQKTYKVTKDILVNRVPESEFKINPEASSIEDKLIVFENKSVNASTYKWNFGDKTLLSMEVEPKHKYTDFNSYRVSLIATSAKGCSDTAVIENNFLEKDYSIYFPNSFRPNTSGPVNEGVFGNETKTLSLFYPANNGAKEYELKIFMGNGSLVFNTNDIKQGWNGYIKGRLAPAGVYIYQAKGVYPNGKSFDLSGKVKVIVDTYEDNY